MSKTRVFLSYSRGDHDFTHRLARALTTLGYVADFDQSDFDPSNIEAGISAEDDWWLRLKELIATADAMIFIVSPASVHSKVCNKEIKFARTLGKRVIPISLQPVDFAALPRHLAKLNVKLSFANAADFETSVSALAAVLDLDVAWHREGARLMALAVKWDRDGRPESQLMPAGTVADTELWANRRPASAPQLGEPLLSYRTKSAEKARADRERLLKITGRAFVKPAEQALAEGRHDAALRLAAAGMLLGEDLSMSRVPELASSVVLAAGAMPLHAVLRGHEATITRVAFSSDGSRIFSASSDKTLRSWDAASGRELETIGHWDRLPDTTAFSPDGTRIVSVNDRVVTIWDAGSGCELASVLAYGLGGVVSAAFSADGNRVFIASSTRSFTRDRAAIEAAVQIWDISTEHVLADLHFGSEFSGASFSPDGSRVVTVHDGTTYVWDIASKRELAVLEVPDVGGFSAAFSPDGARVVTSSEDQTARVWEAVSGRELLVLRGHEGAVSTAEFSPDGTRIVTGSEDQSARVWDAATGRLLAVLRGHEGSIKCVAFSPDGLSIVTGSDDQSVRVWDTCGSTLIIWCGFCTNDDNVAFNPDGTRIVTATEGEPAQVWDAVSGRRVVVLHAEDQICNASFSLDGTRIVAVCGEIAGVWDSASGRRLVELCGHEGNLLDAAFSLDGTRIVTASRDKTARTWNAASGQLLAVLRGHDGQVRGATFNPDASRVLTESFDNTVRLWDATSGRELLVLSGSGKVGYSAAFNPDATRILTCGDDGAVLWDATIGGQLLVFSGHGSVWSCAFHPNGSRLVTASSDETAQVWDATTGRKLAVLQGHTHNINSAKFSPDGDRIVTASSDMTARVWDAASGRELATLHGHDAPVLSAAFNPDGTRIVTAAIDESVRVWDVRRTGALLSDYGELLAASLTRGRGNLVASERRDILFEAVLETGHDLCAALIARLERDKPGTAQRVATQAERLSQLRPICHLRRDPADPPQFEPRSIIPE